VVEGEQLLVEAIRGQWTVLDVFVDPDREVSVDLSRLVVHELKAGVLERVATTESPQAVIAVVRRKEWSVQALRGWILVLDRLADPGNVGTLIRSAEAFGACAVACVVGTAEPFSPKAIRASAGAIFHLPVLTNTTLDALRDRGFRLFGTTSHGDPRTTSLEGADFDGDVAVVLGNEAHGMESDAPVDEWLSIPHVGRSESLNVAMAGTVVSYVVASRRGGGGGRTSVS
jgi:TrmH family RNA methyltransferase